MNRPDPAPPPPSPAQAASRAPGRAAGICALAALLASLLAQGACGSPSTTPPPNPDGGDGGGAPVGDGGCNAWLYGLVPYGDAGLLLDDAGLVCKALLYTDDAGTRTNLSLTLLGARPAGVTSFSAVVTLDGGHPPQQDAGSDAGPLQLGDPLVLQASVSVLLTDAEAYTLQKPPAGPGGSLALRLTQVSDGGPVSAGNVVLTGHGTLDAVVPYEYGPRPDAGTFDAGFAIGVHAEF